MESSLLRSLTSLSSDEDRATSQKTDFNSNFTMRPWASYLPSSVEWEGSLPLKGADDTRDQDIHVGWAAQDTAGA